jgi:hypothetical protein
MLVTSSVTDGALLLAKGAGVVCAAETSSVEVVDSMGISLVISVTSSARPAKRVKLRY